MLDGKRGAARDFKIMGNYGYFWPGMATDRDKAFILYINALNSNSLAAFKKEIRILSKMY